MDFIKGPWVDNIDVANFITLSLSILQGMEKSYWKNMIIKLFQASLMPGKTICFGKRRANYGEKNLLHFNAI